MYRLPAPRRVRASCAATAAAVVVTLSCPWLLPGQSSIFVDESKIRAVLRGDSTVISVPVLNSSNHPVHAELSLSWITVDDKESTQAAREVLIPQGASNIETPLPITKASIWTRLRYVLTARLQESRTFGRTTGILSLARIADYVFEARVSRVGEFRPGASITVHAEAVHPVSRLPVLGVDWRAALTLSDKAVKPKQTLLRPEGFVDFVFEMPFSGSEGSQSGAKVAVAAKRGDFVQTVDLSFPVSSRLSARIQTDKPIYQPGQTLHLRAVVFDAQGKAAPGAEVVLRITGGDRERVHTANLIASDFGVVQDDWQLPASASLGDYQIELCAEACDGYQIAERVVRVSRYELPAFRVIAKPDRTAYLPTQAARVTVTGEFLFGKPVPKGHVKIVRTKAPHWNPKTRKFERSGETVAEGEAKDDGTFAAEIDLDAEHEELRDREARHRFEDIHFDAYYTDVASHRTEQRRFDLRVTREPIHVYVIDSESGGSLPSPTFVTTSYADGRPVSATVTIQLQGRTESLRTNHYGAGRIMLRSGDLENGAIFQATDASGQTGIWKTDDWSSDGSRFRLQTDRTMHRAGQPVTLQIVAPPDAQGRQAVMIHAIAGDRNVATRTVQLVDRRAEITFPYQPEFRRAVVFVAWNAVDPRDDFRSKLLGSRTVIFPDGSDLNLTASGDRTTYKPGDQASLRLQVSSQDGKPVEAALALAVVDQAVLERARTDNEFGRRPWFACAFCRDAGESEIGGVRLNDLYAWKPSSPISPELDLVAEALAVQMSVAVSVESSETAADVPSFPIISGQMKRINAALDQGYAVSLEFPEDLSAFTLALGREWTDLADPWGKPYRVEFSVDGENQVITLMSSGPDKRFGTSDDFSAGTFRRSYFAPVRRLIEQILRKQADYPGTPEALSDLLSENGILLRSTRDPWGTLYRAAVTTAGAFRRIQITSAGPDHKFETKDDFPVANFSGSYFRKEASGISSAIRNAPREPQSIEEFEEALRRAGLDVTRYQDAWGKPYRLRSVVSSRYADRTTARTVQVFGGPATHKTDVAPVTQKFITFSLRSDGPDRVEQTYDDFDIARFPVLLTEESPTAAPPKANPNAAPASASLRGKGTISGVITDPSGGVLQNVMVTLRDEANNAYETASNEQGFYIFASVPPGIYSLRASLTGFAVHEVSQAPVAAGENTTIDMELHVGSVSQSVTVEASPGEMQLSSMASLAAGPVATPRVRDYFPETLLWVPEIRTGSGGTAVTRFKFADSITTWKVAAFASTLDGRTGETELELRTFQPFFLDFNPPANLTVGDQIELPVTIRNYLDRVQSVNVRLEPNSWSSVTGGSSKRASVPPNDSVDVTYTVLAKNVTDQASQRIVSSSGPVSDAIGKTSRVHPDGQEVVRTFGDFVSGKSSFAVSIPFNAVPGANRGELRVYPNIASLLLESATAILTTPHGCAEQTISAGYSNLVALRFARAMGEVDPVFEKRAMANVQLAVESLGALRGGNGGIRYWPASSAPDIAVTAHAVSFLAEASTLLQVNKEDLSEHVSWLEKSQTKDGRWLPGGALNDAASSSRQALLLTGLVAKALAEARKFDGVAVSTNVLSAAYHHIALFTDQTDEPYLLATFVLAALASGDERLPGKAVERLILLGREERGGVYWDLRTNSPFYGWGTAGRYETTGLAVSALAAWRMSHSVDTAPDELDSAIRRGLVFLLRGRDGSGGWYSTQSTLRAMRAISDAAAALGDLAGKGGPLEVTVNGRAVRTLVIPSDRKAIDPLILDLSPFLVAGDNQISLSPSSGSVASSLVRFTSTHWLPWGQTKPRSSPEFRFTVDFDRSDSGFAAGEPVRCAVKAERVGFRGYGMMLAEIGLPPGAEVDRSSLESVVKDGSLGLDRYEILPDRVIFYLWPKAGGITFDFFLTARYGMVAKSAPSILYDYYNPEALAEIAPSRWTVK